MNFKFKMNGGRGMLEFNNPHVWFFENKRYEDSISITNSTVQIRNIIFGEINPTLDGSI